MDSTIFHYATQNGTQIGKKGRDYLQRIKSTKETVWIHDTFKIPFNIRNNQNSMTVLRSRWDPVGIPLQSKLNFSFWNIIQETMVAEVYILY